MQKIFKTGSLPLAVIRASQTLFTEEMSPIPGGDESAPGRVTHPVASNNSRPIARALATEP